jgi:putative sterol carrier protein
MADATTDFFNRLAERGREPLLGHHSGTLRFDLDNDQGTDHWLVEVRNGEVTVRHDDGSADAVIQTDRSVFDRLVTGQSNALAAMLRGSLSVDGDAALLVRFQRLLPGPPAQNSHKSQRKVQA